MKLEETIKQVNNIFIEVLENDSIIVNEETTSKDIDEWDSLNHIMLVVEIEQYFSISFTAEEVNGFKNVGQMSNIFHTCILLVVCKGHLSKIRQRAALKTAVMLTFNTECDDDLRRNQDFQHDVKVGSNHSRGFQIDSKYP